MLDGALAVDPRFVPALVERAHLKVLTADSQGKREMRAAAVADLEQALSIEPGNPRALEIRCQMAQVEVHLSPRATDAAIAAAIKACHTALEADPSSARAHMALARLHDRVCQPGIAMTLLEKGVELDRALAGWLLAQSTEIAMRAGALGVAERASKELVLFVDREKRLGSRAYSRRAGVRPVRGAHVLRASVLLKLDRPDEARAELMRELDTISTGIGDQWNEATALRGLIRIARLRREAVPSALKGRLEALERDYKAAMKDAPNLGYSLASNYRWIEPDVALEWVTKLGPPSTFDGAFERALFYHAAGRDDEARRVLQAHSPKEQWEQTCLEWVHSQVSR
jgi:tetratricopeptide (TPR) repeat protein